MIIAAIPVKNQLHWTAPLVEHLLLGDQVDQVWVYDNGSVDDTRDWVMHRRETSLRLHYNDAAGLGIYQMWNVMVSTASQLGDQCSLAILNNDIRLPIDGLWHMDRMMRAEDYKLVAVDPSRPAIHTRSIPFFDGVLTEPVDTHVQEVTGKDRIGWAFMIAAEWWKDEPYAIHPDYQLWYGDDDLYRRTEQRGGKIGWCRGIGCDHAIESTTRKELTNDQIDAITEKDRDLFYGMWP